jgi:hypothetical protein
MYSKYLENELIIGTFKTKIFHITVEIITHA